jgi:hypothetical protein
MIGVLKLTGGTPTHPGCCSFTLGPVYQGRCNLSVGWVGDVYGVKVRVGMGVCVYGTWMIQKSEKPSETPASVTCCTTVVSKLGHVFYSDIF